MRRQITSFALLAFLLIAASGFFTPRDVIQQTLNATVLVETYDYEANEKSTCTGVMVAPRRAITAAHCSQSDAGFTVDGEESLVMVRTDALLLVMAGDKKPLKIARGIRLQEAVTLFGYGWGEMLVLGRRVAQLHGVDFATDGPLAPGMSGGPAVNQSGELVGINQGFNEVIGVLCGPDELRALLASR